MQKLLSYCNSNDIVETKNFFSQQSMILWSRERIEGLAHLPLREQLKERRIRQIILKPSMNAQALLVPDAGKDTFRLMLRFERPLDPLEWSLCVGHELAHTYFYRKASSGIYHRVNRTWGPWAIEEEICEVFAGMWVEESINYFALYSFLAPITSRGGAINIT